jgi:hypothetical protein
MYICIYIYIIYKMPRVRIAVNPPAVAPRRGARRANNVAILNLPIDLFQLLSSAILPVLKSAFENVCSTIMLSLLQ